MWEANVSDLYEGCWRSEVKVSTDIVLNPGGLDEGRFLEATQ